MVQRQGCAHDHVQKHHAQLNMDMASWLTLWQHVEEQLQAAMVCSALRLLWNWSPLVFFCRRHHVCYNPRQQVKCLKPLQRLLCPPFEPVQSFQNPFACQQNTRVGGRQQQS